MLTTHSFYESNGGISVQSKERDSLEKLFEKYRGRFHHITFFILSDTMTRSISLEAGYLKN